MELPPRLRAALDEALAGSGAGDLRGAGEALSRRYRAEVRDGREHVATALDARAYLATRLPATYAAVRAAMGLAAARLPGFAPASLLDAGAGPGTALFAAADCFESVRAATLVEASTAMRAAGAALSAASEVQAHWIAADLRNGAAAEKADLVTLAYVLDELEPVERDALVERLWALTAGMLLIVEPGTPAGWQRILAARAQLIAAGARIVAPCPHTLCCPLAAPDWCHFAERLPRSRLHRQAKGAEVNYEDEKFIFLAATRLDIAETAARVLARPRAGSGKVELKLCRADGALERRLVTRREGEAFRIARRLDWGDALETP